MNTAVDEIKLSAQEFARLAAAETDWVPVEPVPKFSGLDIKTRTEVATLKRDCPACDNTGKVRIKLLGRATGITKAEEVRCACGRYQIFYAMLYKSVPPHDRFVKLNELRPHEASELSVERQLEVLAELKSDPGRSYAFFGPAGTSKTTFSVALFRQRLWEWATMLPNPHSLMGVYNLSAQKRIAECPIYRVSAKTLLDDFVKESMHEEQNGVRVHPVVNRQRIQEIGKNGALFIEEIDKVNFTKFKTDALFELIDACYENGTQLVFNTNLRFDDFGNRFGAEAGPAIVRRVAEMCTIFDFFGEK